MSTQPAVEIAKEGIQQQPAAVAAPAPVVDEAPEVLELRDAELAARAEADAARDKGTTAAPVVEGAPAAAAPAAGVAAPEPMVPVSALYKERKQRQDAERKAAQLEGAAHAFRQMAEGRTAAPVAGTPEPSIDEQIAAVARDRLQAAEDFDNNKLTARQLEEKRLELEKTERDLREKKQAPVQQVAPVVQDDLALAQHATDLVKNHPVLRLTTEAQLLPLQDLVYAQAAANGETPPTGVLETTWLRERVATLAETIYPNLAAQAKAQFPTTTAPVVAASPAAPAPLSHQAVARDAKLNLAAAHPADISKVGSPASNVGQSEAEIEARMSSMTEDEAIALLDSMPTMKAKLLRTV